MAVHATPPTQTKQVGGAAVFSCGSGDLRHPVRWTKKDGKSRSNAESYGHLALTNLTEEDAGEYVCTADRSLPGSSASVQLIVSPRKCPVFAA